MIKYLLFLLFCVGHLYDGFSQNPSGGWFNVRSYGATGDGKAADTKSINDAIDAAVKAGGGTVLLPAGTFLSYSIHLKSNVCLYLDQGCILLAADSTSGGKYDSPESNEFDKYQDFGHSHWHNSLIWGDSLENISIMGPGIISGKGLSRNASQRRPVGNKAISLKLCRNVMLKDFTVLNGGHFAILATGVDNFTIDNLKMDTNRDGMDIDCCSNVRISNCTINSPYDDAIVLKSSYALGYNRSTQNVTITNCQVSGYDLGTLYNGTYQRKEWNKVPDKEGPTGRIKFGTESNGGFKNIAISNCVFDFCRGLALETVDGALLEDVVITNITMRDVVNSPIFLRLGSRMRGPVGTPPGALRRVTISNVTAYNADSHFASIISGAPGNDIEDIKLNNIRIYYRQLDSPLNKILQVVPEPVNVYPEPAKFGGVLPAYGFFIRHAKNIELNNVEISYTGVETRSPFYIDDVKGIEMFRVKAQTPAGVKRVIQQNNLLSNPDASNEAVAVFRYLKDIYGKKILSGQMWSSWGIDELKYVKEVTGKLPVIRGMDYINDKENDAETQRAIDWWKIGGIPTIMWHWGAPGIGGGYENSKKKIEIDNCFIEGTVEYKSMWYELTRKADQLEKLKDAHVPVLWRPFHELNGNWFWWGKEGPEKFKRLWKTMYDYFVIDRKLNNLIWVLCYTGKPDADWFPGVKYVDIAGADTYDLGDDPQPGMFNKVKAIVGDNMPIAYHECGVPPDPDKCFRDGIMWSWWMEWHTSHLEKVDKEYLKRVYNHELVITLDEVPDIVKVYGVPEKKMN